MGKRKDTISRQAAIDAIASYERDSTAPINYRKIIEELPPADVQPVVRCGECLYFRQHREQSDWCVFWNSTTDIYGFCSEGKRKGADHEQT